MSKGFHRASQRSPAIWQQLRWGLPALLLLAGLTASRLTAQNAPPADDAPPTNNAAQPDAPPADAPPAGGAVGLNEILPPEPPAGLEYEDFTALGGNWTEWGEETAELVRRLYMDETADVAAQRELISSLRQRLSVMEAALGDRRFRTLWNPLTTLHGRLVRRIDLAEAMLDTLALDPQEIRDTRLRQAGRDITESVQALQRELQTIPGGTAWLPYVKADRLTELMQSPADAEAALPVLQSVRAALGNTQSLAPAQQEFLSLPVFASLENSISEYIERAAERHPPLDKAALREQFAALVAAIENFEEEGRLEAAQNVDAAASAIAKLAPDRGARIREVVRTWYNNYNLRLLASEELLTRYIREVHRDSEPIGEQVGEAWVTGSQNSVATTAVDLHPSQQGALFDVTLRGNIRSSTVAAVSRANARIWSTGNHLFNARRSVRFNGDKFTLGPHGVISVNSNIVNTGASTSYDGGLGASTARSRAMSAANSRLGESERRAAAKIRSRVLPEFDQEIEQEFANLNRDFDQQWQAKLRQADLEPSARSVTSTDEVLLWSSRISKPSELAGSRPPRSAAPDRGLELQLHETFLNAMFDRMDIAGQTMTNKEFRQTVDDYLAILFGPDETPDEPSSTSDSTDQYLFAETDPIRFQVENGAVSLIIRTGIRQEGKDDIPVQKITVPLTFDVEQEGVVIRRGSVKVEPLTRPESRSEQIIRARIMATKIEEDLGDRTTDRQIRLPRGEGREDLVLHITQITARNGWMSVSAR